MKIDDALSLAREVERREPEPMRSLARFVLDMFGSDGGCGLMVMLARASEKARAPR